MKTIYRYIPLILGVLAFGYFYLYRYVHLNKKYFYENTINTKVIKIKDYAGKSLEFYYSDDYCITTTNTVGDTLYIGDSISKHANSSEFKVFRKNKFGVYEFYKKYQYED